MYTIEPTSKLEAYQEQEQAGQFSQEKAEEIYKKRLGLSKMSPGLALEFEAAKRHADLKGTSLFQCEWCGNPVEVKSSREIVHLCARCSDGREIIEQFLKANKKGSLTDADRLLIKSRKITRLGGHSFRLKYND